MRNMQFSGLLWAHRRGLCVHHASNPSGFAASQSFSSLCTNPGLSCLPFSMEELCVPGGSFSLGAGGLWDA